MKIAAFVLALTQLVACGDSDPDTSRQQASVPEAPIEDVAWEGPADETTEAPADSSLLVAPDREELRRRARADAVVLRRARLASHEGRHARAFALIEPLLEQNPRGRRLHCEAGYLAYRAGELDRAGELLDTGLRLHGPPADVPETLRRALAMCLYNRGRLHEDREERGRAAALYRVSLGLRPNRVVRARLADLGDVSVVEVGADTNAREWNPPRRVHGSDIESVCRAMAQTFCPIPDDATEDEIAEAPVCVSDPEPLEVGGTGPRVVRLLFEQVDSEYGVDVLYAAIIEDGGVDVVGPLAVTNLGGQYPSLPGVENAMWSISTGACRSSS